MANEEKDVSLEQGDAAAYFDQITGVGPEKDVNDEFEPEKPLDLAEEEIAEAERREAEQDTEIVREGEPAETKPAAQPDQTNADPFADATEAQRQYLEQLKLQQARADNNVRASAGKIAALTKQLNELSKAQQKPVQPGELKLEGKSFEEVERDWPELADYVRSHVREAMKMVSNTVDERLQPIHQGFQQLTAREQQEQIIRERDALAQAHPDFVQINQSLDFENWMTQQPEWVHGLRQSYSAIDNIKLLNLYKAERGLPAASQRPAAPQAPARADLSAHAELPRRGAGAKPQTPPDDPEAYFDFITRPKR